MKVVLGQVIFCSNVTKFKKAVKTDDGLYLLVNGDDYSVGDSIIAKYEPADQFCFGVSMEKIAAMLEKEYA